MVIPISLRPATLVEPIPPPYAIAGSGICLLGDGKGDFRPLSPAESGIYLPGDVRDLQSISLIGGIQGTIMSQSNGPLHLLKLY